MIKNYTAYLKDSLIAGLLGLPVGTLAGGLGMGLAGFITDPVKPARLTDAITTGMAFSLFALLFGVPSVLLYGAPVHALLARRGYSKYLTTATVGAVPGAAVMLRESGIGLLVLYFGICIAVAGQWVANRRRLISRSNSPRPTNSSPDNGPEKR